MKSPIILPFAFFLMLLSLGCSTVPETKSPPPDDREVKEWEKEKSQSLLIAADNLWEIKSKESLLDSIKYLNRARKLNYDKGQIYWRLGRSYYTLFERADSSEDFSLSPKEKSERPPGKKITPQMAEWVQGGLEVTGKGLKFLKDKEKRMGKSPSRPLALTYYYRAIHFGLQAKVNWMEAMGRVNDSIRCARKAIEIDPSIDRGGPHRYLGYLYMELPGFLGGSSAKSLHHFKKALEKGPQCAENHLGLARAYIRAGKVEKGAEILEVILKKKNFQNSRRELYTIRSQARQLRKKLPGEEREKKRSSI